jgi:hypothetical protein
MGDSPPPTKETRVGTPLRSSIAGFRVNGSGGHACPFRRRVRLSPRLPRRPRIAAPSAPNRDSTLRDGPDTQPLPVSRGQPTRRDLRDTASSAYPPSIRRLRLRKQRRSSDPRQILRLQSGSATWCWSRNQSTLLLWATVRSRRSGWSIHSHNSCWPVRSPSVQR